jgi:hypothetical protein
MSRANPGVEDVSQKNQILNPVFVFENIVVEKSQQTGIML